MNDLVTIQKFTELTGYTDAAVRSKMAEGVWLEDHVWIKAPDNRILVSIRGYSRWAAGESPESNPGIRRTILADGEPDDAIKDLKPRRSKRWP